MKLGIGATLQPTPDLLKLIRKNSRLSDFLKFRPMSLVPVPIVRQLPAVGTDVAVVGDVIAGPLA